MSSFLQNRERERERERMVKCICSVNPPAEFIVKEEGPAYVCVNVIYIKNPMLK